MSILTDKHVFYSYNDVNGQGINPEYLTTYNKSVIFDPLNRALYAGGGIYGNHDFGTYHGEIFNDFSKNHAYGDYSSASGHVTTAYNESEYAVGRYNMSRRGKTIFTVGNGKNNQPENAFEIHSDNTSYINGDAYVDDNLYIKNDVHTYHDLYVHNDLHVDGSTYTDGDYDVNGYFHVHDYLQVDGDTYLYDTAYLYNGAYTYNQSYVIGSSYVSGDSGVSGSAYTGGSSYVSGDLHVNGPAYLEGTAYLNSTAYIKHSYSDEAWVGGIEVKTAYSYAMSHISSYVGGTTKDMVKTMGLGQFYIWRGTESQLPPAEERYDNVIYLVLDEMPSTGRTYTDI